MGYSPDAVIKATVTKATLDTVAKAALQMQSLKATLYTQSI